MLTALREKEFFDYFIVLMPLIMTGFAWYISYLQSKVSREKLRLDLYNKRFGVYEAALNFQFALSDYSHQMHNEYKSKHVAFIKAMRESQFIFSKESKIFSILKQMNIDSFKVTSFHDLQRNSASYIPHDKTNYDAMLKALQDLDIHISSLGDEMAPYLNFHALEIQQPYGTLINAFLRIRNSALKR